MKYFEQGCEAVDLPGWVGSSIKLGYLAGLQKKQSTLHLVSSPFESNIAPFIALGAMRAALENPDANLCKNYFSMLRASETHFLQLSADKDPQWHVLKVDEPKMRYRFKGESDSSCISVTGWKKGRGKNTREPFTSLIFEGRATDWQINGYPVPRCACTPDFSLESILNHLPGCTGSIHPENLSSSWLGHVLVCSSSDENSNYVKSLKESGLALDDSDRVSLDSLLMIGNDAGSSVQRMTVIGERQLANHHFHQTPSLIIADGARALLSVWDLKKKIDGCTVIGVIHRSGSEGALEDFEGSLREKERYYSDLPQPIHEYASPYIQVRSMEKVR